MVRAFLHSAIAGSLRRSSAHLAAAGAADESSHVSSALAILLGADQAQFARLMEKRIGALPFTDLRVRRSHFGRSTRSIASPICGVLYSTICLPISAEALSKGKPPVPEGFFDRSPVRRTSRKMDDGDTVNRS